jgi:polysaccharide export outer membrane protein
MENEVAARPIACISAVALLLSMSVASPLLADGHKDGKSNAESSPAVHRTPLYVIQPNDLLEVFVWKEPDLTRKVLVRPDGRISFPLVQDLQAAGMTPGELKEQVEGKLAEFLESPNVTIIVEAIQSYRVYVTGKVQKPGALTSEKPVTVLQALTMAGGLQEFANAADMTILRNHGEENVVFRFHYKDVVQGKNPEQNILLKSGDVVVVP